MEKPSKQCGVTLIELIVSLSILAILLLVALPNFTVFNRTAELSATANTLLAAINTARSEAINRGRSAMVMPSDGSNWQKGWVVFVDNNSNGVYDNLADTTLSVQSSLPPYFSITTNGSASKTAPYIRFNPMGYINAGLSFQIQNKDVTGSEPWRQVRKIVISLVGRVRLCTPSSASDSDCTPL